MIFKQAFKVDVPNSVTTPNSTPIFELHVPIMDTKKICILRRLDYVVDI